jgi:NAD-dependent DNA ligase
MSSVSNIINNYSLNDIYKLLVDSDNLYYNGIHPELPSSSSIKPFIELTDDEYDLLKDYYNNKSQKQYNNIGHAVSNNKVTLPIHMGSMDKIKKDTTELKSFLKKYTHAKCISEKLDGISLLLDLTSKSINAYTRGDGKIGQNVSHIINFIKNLREPLNEFKKNEYTYNGYIRGELIISKGNWSKINNKGKNARNYVSGIVNKKEVSKDDFKYIEFIAYQYIPHPITIDIITPSIQFRFLEKAGYKIPKYELFPNNLIKSDFLLNTLLEWKEKSNYEIDGIIIADNHTHSLTLDGNPDYAKAFKFNSIEDSTSSTVKNVEWNVSKDGRLKPTIIIEPIDIDGVTIKRATAFNARYIVDNNIGKGAIVRLIRSGGVIPYIVGVEKGVEPDIPNMEKDNLVWDKNNIDIMMSDISRGINNVDTNSRDSEDNINIDESVGLTMTEKMEVKKIEHFVNVMKIENYKTKTIEKGFIKANIKNIYDLLKANKETFEKIDGIRDKTSSKIVNSINKQINSMPIYIFTSALSVFPKMGEAKLYQLFEHSSIINELVDMIKNNSLTSERTMIRRIITIVEGYSEISARVIIENFIYFYEIWEYVKINYPNSKIAKYPNDDSVNSVIDIDDEKNNNNLPILKDLNNMRIIFTGFRNHDLEKHISRYNGYVSDTITKSDKGIILVKDKNKITAKIVKGQSLGYSIMTEEEFLNEYSV